MRDDESIWKDTRTIVEHYVALENVESRMDMLKTEPRVIVSLAPSESRSGFELQPSHVGLATIRATNWDDRF